MGRMNSYAAAIGDEVRAARARRRMNQQALADQMGITKEKLMRREAGRVSFTAEQLDQVANILNVDLLTLYPNKVL